ncbi:MAG: hypothetical protein QF685_13075, partial [Verrucomicrobiota bacterium]|nr:hypothetical protein [Verrucomicrobiota bacterium]
MNKERSFTPVFDSRKRKLRNLWKRSDRFYARIKIAYPGEERAKTRRVPLKARNVTEAAKELRELLVKRDKGRTITRERNQTLADFAALYIDRIYAGNRTILIPTIVQNPHGNFTKRISKFLNGIKWNFLLGETVEDFVWKITER